MPRTAAVRALGGAGVDGCPAHRNNASPCVRCRSCAAASTSITWNGATSDLLDGFMPPPYPRPRIAPGTPCAPFAAARRRHPIRGTPFVPPRRRHTPPAHDDAPAPRRGGGGG